MGFPNVIYGDYSDHRVTATSRIGNLPLGTKMVLPDGREFRHAHVSATALVAGKLYQQEAYAAGTGNIKSLAVIAGSALINTKTISVTMSATGAMTKDQYQDGYVFVPASTGAGYVYKVKSCSSAAAGSTSVITLYDDLEVSLAGGTTTVGVRVNEYDNVLLTTANTVGVGTLAGVSACSAAANSYVWLQTKGPAPILTDNTTLIVGIPVSASSTVAGAVAVENITAADTAGTGVHKGYAAIGWCMSVAASAEYSLIDLNIR